jgi:predicted dehydrogenase
MKISLVGANGYWCGNYIRTLKELGVEIGLLCDKNIAGLEKYNLPVTDSLDDIMKSDSDGVIVCTPVTTHYNIVKDLLLAGKNVMCEKIFTPTSSQAIELTEIAANNDLKLLVGHTFIFNSCYQFMKQFIEDGGLGDVYYVNMVRVGNSPKRMDIGCVGDLAAHDFSMLIDLFGMPQYVTAFGNSYLNDGLEDIATINLEFKNDVIATITCSWLNPRKERRVTVVGSEAMLVFDDIEKSVTVFNKEGENKIDLEYKSPLKEQVIDFINSIEKDEEPLVGGYEGIQVVKVLEACNESLKQRNGKD